MSTRREMQSNPIMLSELGARVRNFRSESNLSQEDLGERAGLHRTYVGHVERGEVNPTIESIVTLAEALGIETEALTAGLRLDAS